LFKLVIKERFLTNGVVVSDHFVDVNEMIKIIKIDEQNLKEIIPNSFLFSIKLISKFVFICSQKLLYLDKKIEYGKGNYRKIKQTI
jgi:hypothetical protein